jgi:hypothetical protein
VLQIAPEPIELPGDHDIELPPPGVFHQLVERRPRVLRASDPVVDVFHGGPATGLGIAPQLDELVLGMLINGGHSNVESSVHRRLLGRGLL